MAPEVDRTGQERVPVQDTSNAAPVRLDVTQHPLRVSCLIGPSYDIYIAPAGETVDNRSILRRNKHVNHDIIPLGRVTYALIISRRACLACYVCGVV